MNKIDTIIQTMQGSIIEIGGPTPGGYEFLKDATTTMPVEPIITNISHTVTHNPFGKKPEKFEIDEVVNVKRMPYEDKSVGVIIACSLPLSDDDIFQAFETEQERDTRKAIKRLSALQEYEDFSTSRSFDTNLHIALIVNAAKALIEGGLLIIEQAREDDEKVAKLCGFEIIFQDDNSSTFVFRKV